MDGGATASYGYDQQNQRIKKVSGTSVTHCVWDGGQVLAEHNGSTGAVITNYTYAGSRMINKTTSGTTSYFLNDRLSARLTLDSSGNVIGRQAHLPFGEDLNASGTTDKHKMTSYERDTETGNDYAVNRGYTASTGRFNQADPYRASGGAVDPQSWNRYAYSRNDAINLSDPAGLSWAPIIIIPPTFSPPGVVQVYAGPSVIDAQAAGGAAGVMEYWRTHPRLTDGEPRKGDRGEPEKIPCQNVDGFTVSVGGYSPQELNDAAITLFGEMAGRFNSMSGAEAEAIASVILNRSTAIANGTAPPNGQWGATASLSDVVQASGQFAGYRQGQSTYASGVDLSEGERNCNRLQAAGSAINYLAGNLAARKPYLYMCAKGHVTTPHSDDVEINGNIFSDKPQGCV